MQANDAKQPNIDFYLVKRDDADASDRVLITLCEKALARDHRIFILTENSGEAQRLDEWLWTYDEMRFLAHTRVPNLANEVPITLSFDKPIAEHRDIFINLSGQIPDYTLEFARVLHIVPNQPERRQHCRQQYRDYQAQGLSIQTHEILAR